MALRAYLDIHPQLANRAYVDDLALIIGDVSLGEDSSVWPFSVVRGDVQQVRIGARTNIQDSSVVHVSHDSAYLPGGAATLIGDDVTVGHRVILHGCRIGDRCLIGMGAIVMDHAVLDAETVLGAGSLVTEGKHLEGGYLWLGQPVRRVRELTPQEREYLRYSARHYVKLKNNYLEAR
jgi:carbonic anhydrase/acetyltransferase-like protein (isoleucine patch superfamily)